MVPARADSPHLPLRPDEIAEDCGRSYRAGASLLDLHARDAQGSPTDHAGVYREIAARLSGTRRQAERMRERGIVPGLETFDRGMVDYAEFLVTRQLGQAPAPRGLVFDGQSTCWGAKAVFEQNSAVQACATSVAQYAGANAAPPASSDRTAALLVLMALSQRKPARRTAARLAAASAGIHGARRPRIIRGAHRSSSGAEPRTQVIPPEAQQCCERKTVH
jgi:uncharacterized protein (DUF849 family)